MVLGIAVDLSALPYFLHLFPSPHRAGVPGRLVPVGSDCASWREVVSRSSAHSRSEKRARVESGVWPGLPIREAVRRWAGDQSERSGRRGGPELEADVVPPRPGHLVRDWIILLAYHLGIWAGPCVAHCLQCRLLGQAFVGKPVHEGPRVYEPDTYQV